MKHGDVAMGHDANVIGAAVLLVADRIRDAVEATAGRRGAQAAALTALHGWANGHSIDDLARGLGLSHSRTVRILDALAESGLATRGADPADRRQATVTLTGDGTATAVAILRARQTVLDEVLASMPSDVRTALAHACEAIVLDTVNSRDAARLACRLCDVEACGHHDGRCPSTQAADQGSPQ